MSTSAPEFSWSLRAFRFLLLHGTLKTPSVNGPFLNNNRSVSCRRAKNMRSLRNINLLPTLKTEVSMKLTLESKMCHIYFSFWCMHESSANIHQRKVNVFIICHQNLMTWFMSETLFLFRLYNPRALYFFACHQFPRAVWQGFWLILWNLLLFWPHFCFQSRWSWKSLIEVWIRLARICMKPIKRNIGCPTDCICGGDVFEAIYLFLDKKNKNSWCKQQYINTVH